MAFFLYVNNNSRPNSVTAYSVADNGSLTELPGSPFLTGGDGGDIGFEVLSATAAAAFGKLYASNSTSQDVSGFNINQDGTLTPLPGSPYKTNTDVAAGVTIAPLKRILYVTSTCSEIAAFKIQADGSLVLLPGSPFGPFLGTGFMPVVNKEETLLFSDCRTDLIGRLLIQPDGSLIEAGPPFEAETFNSHGLALSNDGKLLFICGGADPRIEVLAVAPDGTLTRVPGSPFPAQVNTPEFCAVNPVVNLLFVCDAISDNLNLALFTFDSTGTLTTVAGSPFASGGAGPRMFTINPAGTLFFAANSLSQNVSVLTQAGPIPGSPFPGLTGLASGIALVQVAPFQVGRSLFPNKHGTYVNFLREKDLFNE